MILYFNKVDTKFKSSYNHLVSCENYQKALAQLANNTREGLHEHETSNLLRRRLAHECRRRNKNFHPSEDKTVIISKRLLLRFGIQIN